MSKDSISQFIEHLIQSLDNSSYLYGIMQQSIVCLKTKKQMENFYEQNKDDDDSNILKKENFLAGKDFFEGPSEDIETAVKFLSNSVLSIEEILQTTNDEKTINTLNFFKTIIEERIELIEKSFNEMQELCLELIEA